VLAVLLPARVDSSVGEVDLDDTLPLPATSASRDLVAAGDPRGRAGVLSARLRARVLALPVSVRAALVSAMGGRLLTGFLTLFMAFLMRENPIPGHSGTLVLALVVGAAGAGNALGTVVGNASRRLPPDRIVATALLVIVGAALATALAYSLVTLLVLGLCAGLCSQVIKLSTDAIIQRDVAENVRTSVFAWSETVLQIAWVVGGGLGIALPLVPQLGFGVISALLVVVLALSVQVRRTRPRALPDQ
jgi:hypothetical protein